MKIAKVVAVASLASGVLPSEVAAVKLGANPNAMKDVPLLPDEEDFPRRRPPGMANMAKRHGVSEEIIWEGLTLGSNASPEDRARHEAKILKEYPDSPLAKKVQWQQSLPPRDPVIDPPWPVFDSDGSGRVVEYESKVGGNPEAMAADFEVSKEIAEEILAELDAISPEKGDAIEWSPELVAKIKKDFPGSPLADDEIRNAMEGDPKLLAAMLKKKFPDNPWAKMMMKRYLNQSIGGKGDGPDGQNKDDSSSCCSK